MGVNTAFFARFKKVIALVGSDREGERHSAADKAFEMCEQNDLSIQEAMEGAFGGTGDDGDAERAEQLERKIAELEDDNRKLSEALNILNANRPLSPETGKELLQKLWSYPQARLLSALLTASCVVWLVPQWARWLEFLHRGWGIAAMWALLIALATDVWEWSAAEFARRGLGVTLLKAVVLLAGIFLAVAGLQRDAVGCCIALFFTGILTLTNGAEWLADKLAHSNDEWCVALRSWFL